MWYDSDNQEIIFNLTKRTIESGWTVTVYGSSITSWTCQSNTTDTNSLLFLLVSPFILLEKPSHSLWIYVNECFSYYWRQILFDIKLRNNLSLFRFVHLLSFSIFHRADQQVDVSGTKYNVFKCIRYERVTDFSYKYYIYNGMIISDSDSIWVC